MTAIEIMSLTGNVIVLGNVTVTAKLTANRIVPAMSRLHCSGCLHTSTRTNTCILPAVRLIIHIRHIITTTTIIIMYTTIITLIRSMVRTRTKQEVLRCIPRMG